MKPIYFLLITLFFQTTLFAQVYVLNEDFVTASGINPPLEWANYKINGTDNDLWHFDNPGDRAVNFPVTAPFAVFDSDTVSGNGQSEKVGLESPFFDASISDFILLLFDQTFVSANGAVAIIEAFNGTEWTEVKRFTASTVNSISEVVDISSVVGGITNAKIRFIWEGQSKGYWALDNVSILAPLPVDGGLVKLDSPIEPFNEGVQPVKITIGNFGYQNMSSTTIKWKMNGVQQPNFTWNGNLSIGQVQEDVQIGTYNFTGNPVEVTIWQYLPNGIDDSNPFNDSVVKTVRPSLCGEYTIGGNNPDFLNFNQAVNVLNNAGISCPVIFKVRNGDYNEQFILEDIQGSSEQNIITFESESGDSTGVIVRNEVWPLTTVLLRKTKYVHFKEIGFRGTYIAMLQSNTFQIHIDNCYLSGYYPLLLDDQSNNILVNNCLTQGGDYNIGIRSGSHDISISNSQINGGTWGIVIQNGLQHYANVTITDNILAGQSLASINTSGTNGVIIDRNIINDNSTGIYADNTYNIIISNNIINSSSGSYWHNSGIHFENTTDTVNIYNNFIHISGNFRSDGIFIQNSNNTQIAFNSINLTNNEISRTSRGLCIIGGDQIDVRNNIYSIEFGGYPAFLTGSFTNLTIDYNDYYNTTGLIGQINGTNFYSLAEWQSVNGNDLHSFAENPFFTSSSDLSINQALLNNNGTSIPGIPNDIDGIPRNSSDPDIGAREYQPCNADAGINKISEPESPVSSGEHEVKVILQNQGTSSLNSAIIHWEVNGISQPQFLWSGNLAEKAFIELSVGLFNFEGGLSTIRAWTELPNGINDCNHVNDTSIGVLTGSLCGIYTIGGQNPDFSTFTEAAMVLNTAGISCPVVFKVRNGDYNEQIILDGIPGNSSQNSITFESETGDSTAVILRYEVWPDITLQIKNIQNIRFKEMGFRGNHFAIQLSKVTDFQMDNCFISGYYNLAIDDSTNQVEIGHSNLQASDWAIGIRSGSKNIQIHDCIFNGANYGIVVQPGIQLLSNISIFNNEFTQQSYASINTASARGITITDNEFTTNRTGIYSDNSKNLLISDNRIHIFAQADWYNSGIHLETLTDSVNIFNNFVLTSGIYKSEGIFLQNSSRSKVFYNSINITNSDIAGDSKAIYINGGEQIDFQNNILRISKLGFPIYLTGTTINLMMDYNNFYHPELLIGHNNTTDYFSLADWKIATGQDTHSYSVDPYFTSDMDLSVNQSILNNAGIPISEIQNDIDGSVRNNTHPDIGAKEFSLCVNDVGINQISSPSYPLSEGNKSIKVILQNHGTNILSSAIIHWKVNGQTQPQYNWNGNLIEKANTEVTIGNFNFTDGLFTIKAWTTLPNEITDCNNINDTISKKVSTTLCGEYTIGGNSPDFLTFTDAVTALTQSGISCPVTFKIRDGEYIERFLLKEIQGSSAVNTITFQSESSDSSAVIIRFSDYSTSTIQLYNAKYINFNKISIQGYWGLMVDNSEYININNCSFTNGLWTRFNSQFIKIENCYFSNGIAIESGSKHIDIESNELIGGSISVGNDWGNYVQDIEILNNHFNLGSGISSTYSKGVTIKNNDFFSNQSGLRFYSSNNLTITENFFNIYQSLGWDNHGLRFESVDTLNVINNYIFTNGNAAGTGILINSCYHTQLYFNSINRTNLEGQNGGWGIYLTGGNLNSIKNNIFNIQNYGYPVVIQAGTNGYSFDFNDYYSPSGIIGRFNDVDYSDLGSWGAAIQGDANSKNVPPYYAAEDNPLPYQRDFNGAAIPIQPIQLDINGNIRNDQAPDIGAVEFMIDYGITQLITPNLECTHGPNDSINVYLRQFGDIPFKDMRLSYQVNGGIVYTDTILGTIYNDLQYTFKTPVDMATDGEYIIRVWLISTRDDNINNDTLIATRYTKPAPVVDFSWSNDCTGREVFFTGTASVSDPYFIEKYEWYFGDGDSSQMQNAVHTFAQAGTHQVTLRAYSNAGCYNEITKTVSIDEYEKLVFDLAHTNEICSNSCDGELTINIIGGQSPVQLFFNDQLITQNTMGNLCPGDYIIRAIDNKGCEISDTVKIITESPMTLAVLADPVQGYAPFDVDLSALVTGAASYEWIYNGETIGTEVNSTFSMTDPGDQYIKLIVSSGPPNYCTLEDSVSIRVEIFVIIDIPNAFTPNKDGYNDTFGPTSKGLKSMEMKIKDRNGRLVHTIDAVDGRWDGTTESGSESPQGIYYYTLTATGYDEQTYNRQGSVNLFRDLIDLTPNPVANLATLDMTGKMPGDKEIIIYNASGILVSNWKTSDNKIEMDLSGLSPGLFTLKVSGNDQIIIVKFIKE